VPSFLEKSKLLFWNLIFSLKNTFFSRRICSRHFSKRVRNLGITFWYGSTLWYDSSKVRFEFWCKSFYRSVLRYWAKTLLKDFKGNFLCWDKFSGESEFGKDLRFRSEWAVWILLFTSFWPVDFLFGNNPFFKRMWQLVLGFF